MKRNWLIGCLVMVVACSVAGADVFVPALQAKDFGDLGTLTEVAGWPAATVTLEQLTGAKLRGEVTCQVFNDTLSDDYLYMYQVANTGDDSTWHKIEVFTIWPFVGADGSSEMGYLTGGEPAAFDPAGTRVPIGAFIDTDTAEGSTVGFAFYATLLAHIAPGQTSKVLYIRSDAPPSQAMGNIIDGTIAQNFVIAPVPEPASIALLLGGVGWFARRRR